MPALKRGFVGKFIHLHLHKEPLDDGRLVWWAQSPDFPGWCAAGDTKEEVLSLAHWAMEFAGHPGANLVLCGCGICESNGIAVTHS